MDDEEVLHNAEMMVEALSVTESNLLFWLQDLKARHDRVLEDMKHPDDYQQGYLHGVTQCIEYLQETVPILEQRKRWAKELIEETKRKLEDD